jgi:hypothetical protein
VTEYTDLPTTNALYAESQQIIEAIANLDAGGTISSVMVDPPPPPPLVPGEPSPTATFVPVLVVVTPPVDPALLGQFRTWMQQRLAEISTSLTDLGVSVPPTSQITVQRTLSIPTPPPPMPPPMPPTV